MKFQSLAVAAALALTALTAPSTVSAVECTDAQIDGLDNNQSAAVETACPTLFSEDEDALNPTRIEALDAAALATIEPCKAATCLTELKQLVSAVPDCTVAGLSVKATYQATVTLCEAFNAGSVTVAKAKEIFQDVTKNITNAIDSLLGGSDADDDDDTGSAGGATDVPAGTTASPNNSTSDDTPVATTPSSVPSPTPAPTTSGASGSIVAGVTVVVATTFASSVLL